MPIHTILHGKPIHTLIFGLSFLSLFFTVKVKSQTLGANYTSCGLSVQNLGGVPGVPLRYGGMVFKYDDTDVLLLGGEANDPTSAIYSVPLIRNVFGEITGFNTASYYADANDPDGSGIDGGLAYLPGNVLAYVTYGDGWMGQLLPGSTVADKMIDLLATPGWNAGSTGSLKLVPSGILGQGRLKIGSYDDERWHDVSCTLDGSGTFDITINSDFGLSHDICGIVYVPGGCIPCFTNDAVLIGSYDDGRVYAYDVDAIGDPIPATRTIFIDNISNQVGAAIDPITGDLLFVDYGGSNAVIIVRNAGCPEDIDEDNDGIPDSDEGCAGSVCVDTDGDGIEDYLDLDSDNDGILDIVEGGDSALDTDSDGDIDANDVGFTDFNGNGMDDDAEATIPTDIDGDGIADHLDLDSDADGCPDALEGDYSFTLSDLDANGRLSGGVDSDGVPTITGSPQGVGSAYDASAVVCCDATASGYLDTDGDGVSDLCDLDDDNDGILDTDEALLCDFDTYAINTPPDDYIIWGISNPQRFENVNSTDFVASGSGVSPSIFGSGILNVTYYPNSPPNDNGFSIEGVDQTNLANAILYNDYVEYEFETASDLSNAYIALSGVVVAFNETAADGFTYSVAISDDNFMTSTPLVTDVNLDDNNQVELSLLPTYFGVNSASTYKVRIYIYAVDNGTTMYWDDFAIGFDGCVADDTDGDGISDHLDLDADNDGIPDNVEAQTTKDYRAPSGSGTGITDTNSDGLDDNFDAGVIAGGSPTGIGFTPVNTDSSVVTDAPDYLDLDSDEDGTFDIAEAGLANNDGANADPIDGRTGNSVGNNGLDNDASIETADDYTDVNGLSYTTGNFTLADSDNDTDADGSNAAPLGIDFDYRDNSNDACDPSISDNVDTDGDGVTDFCDIDDDNDGILDDIENCGISNQFNSSDLNAVGTGAVFEFSNVFDYVGNAFGTGNETLLPPSGNSFLSGYDSQGGNGFVTLNFSPTVDLVVPADRTITIRHEYFNNCNQNLSFAPSLITKTFELSTSIGLITTDYTLSLADQNALKNSEWLVLDIVYTIPVSQPVGSIITLNSTAVVVESLNGGITPSGFDPNTSEVFGLTTSAVVTCDTDTDGDGLVNGIDLDSDDDGIPDNIEAQSTGGYVAPGALGASMVDNDNDGLNDVYDADTGDTDATASAGLTPVDTEGDTISDFIDTDSDGDGTFDIAESGLANNDSDNDGRTNALVGNNGLDDDPAIEAADDYTDVNGLSYTTGSFTLADSDNDTDADGSNAAPLGIDLDYRDNSNDECDASISSNVDTDGDGVTDICDIDDDNDGILDTVDGTPSTLITWPNYFDLNPGASTSTTVTRSNGSTFDVTLTNSINSVRNIDRQTIVNRIGESLFENTGFGTIRSVSSTPPPTTGLVSFEITFSEPVDVLITDGENSAINEAVFNVVTNGSSFSIIDEINPQFVDVSGEGTNTITFNGNNAPPNFGAVLFASYNATSLTVSFNQPSAGLNGIALGFINPDDTDGDTVPNNIDLDSDDDGIPDNIEAQTTGGYIAPGALGASMVDNDNDGLNDVYDADTGDTDATASAGLTPVDTEGDTISDFIDTDSDGDGTFDITEAGLANNDGDNDGRTNALVGNNGLDDDPAIEAADDYTDVNGLSYTTGSFTLADSDNDTDADGSNAAPLGIDLDYRDNSNDECDASISSNTDTDGDGVTNTCDLDDDNDGILDSEENLVNIFDHIYSDNTWTKSTTILPGGGSGWSGIDAYNLPSVSTYTDPVTVSGTGGFGTGFINADPNMITFYRQTFNVSDPSEVLGLTVQTYIDNHAVIFINGKKIGSVLSANESVGTLFSMLISNQQSSNVNPSPATATGYLNPTGLSAEEILVPGQNEIIYVVGDYGVLANFAFALHINLPGDTDLDGISDYLDLDSDNDGIFDLVEAGHGESDADNDGIIDGAPASFGVNGFFDALELVPDGGTPNYTVSDSDMDGTIDAIELDSDDDGCLDVIEAGFTDDDNDGILGTSPVSVDANGLVTSGTDGYTQPNDLDANATFDFQEAGSAPSMTSQPTDVVGIIGNDATFTATASGSNLIYQWQTSTDEGATFTDITDGIEYTGSQTTTLTVLSPTIQKNGHLYRAVIRNVSFICDDETITSQAELKLRPKTVIMNRRIRVIPHKN